MSEAETVEALHERILTWVDEGHLREFPWRNTESPYEVLVAEVLLQQTPAERVEPVYVDFLEEYPTLEALADADPDEVVDLIEELGLHNKRGRALVENARDLVDEGVPRDREALTNLSYVLDYGANAVLCFAFGEDRAIVDTNVIRVYNRVFDESWSVDDSEAWEFATDILPDDRVRDYNLGLLDFAAAICQPTPKCSECFLADQCAYFRGLTTKW